MKKAILLSLMILSIAGCFEAPVSQEEVDSVAEALIASDGHIASAAVDGRCPAGGTHRGELCYITRPLTLSTYVPSNVYPRRMYFKKVDGKLVYTGSAPVDH